jgi:hypothetical protein
MWQRLNPEERFARSPGEYTVGPQGLAGVDNHDVKIPAKFTVLKSVVQNENRLLQFLGNPAASQISILRNPHPGRRNVTAYDCRLVA